MGPVPLVADERGGGDQERLTVHMGGGAGGGFPAHGAGCARCEARGTEQEEQNEMEHVKQ